MLWAELLTHISRELLVLFGREFNPVYKEAFRSETKHNYKNVEYAPCVKGR